MKKLLGLLRLKGRIASLAGFLIAMPINAWSVINHIFLEMDYSYDQLRFLFVVNFIGWIWVVLPSRVSIKMGRSEIIIED